MPWNACAQAALVALRWGSAASVALPRTSLHEQMLANYRALYDETAQAFDLPREGE